MRETGRAARAREPRVEWDPATGKLVLSNDRLELLVETAHGLNARQVRDVDTGRCFADADYCWPGAAVAGLTGTPRRRTRRDGSISVVFTATLGSLEVEQSFLAPAKEPGVLLENIRISNRTRMAIDTSGFSCGFAKRLRSGDKWSPDSSAVRFCPVPYRKETDGRLMDFPLAEAAGRGMSYGGWQEEPVMTSAWGSEGWAWTDGSACLLVAKYNPDALEWSLMESLQRGTDVDLRFGGAGQWKHGHPEASMRLAPGGTFLFGETRLQVVDGGWQQGFTAFRRAMEGKGCRTPAGYDPPVHWNELYDNEYFFKSIKLPMGPGFISQNHELQEEFYTAAHMKAEAAKARELGCEALYMDPGWDTAPSHQVWDAARFGAMGSFVRMLRDEYGLKMSLWIGLGGVPPTYADPNACPPEARVVDAGGTRTDIHCMASRAFLRTKEKRLLDLCRHGVSFLMFDSTQFSGPCHDATHGHRVPSTREEHAEALIRLAQRVKRRYPGVLIEMHDLIAGPGGLHYTPAYYGLGRPRTFDCLWGHEFMWNTWEDLRSGRALSLYFYNLALSVPLYLHVNLKEENEHALIFWWFASTCRHLGVGGKPGPVAWEACRRAMKAYAENKRFFTQGVFHGIEETIHAHTLPEIGQVVINCFNLDTAPVQRRIRIQLSDIGLPPGPVRVVGAPFEPDSGGFSLSLDIPALGHRLVKVSSEGFEGGRTRDE